MKKRLITLTLALILAFSLTIPAGAVHLSGIGQGDEYIITTGGSISYVDANGDTVVEELGTSTTYVSAETLEIGIPIEIAATSTKTYDTINYFLNDKVRCYLKAKFVYEAGYSVTGSVVSSSTTITSGSGYEKVREYTKVTNGAASQWSRVTYTSVILKPDNSTKECNTWIECTRAGSITEG